ncbi:AAA family ATPase [Crateriforma conspicua]|uniref:Regulatory protein RepA n=1 Tax=Crateriforma conspicua TaxID=2527996 RepID=A0A5C5YAU6_9PLAN|nr:AAA family ATPase [Crateriforma conspicua]TWT71521.1 hypothetical protein Pan14r_38310 [Crateriforma conspicua]
MNETSPTRYYNDGPNHPRTPLAARAEKAYREWFAKTAADVPRWTKPNETAFAAFMRDRTVARRRAVVGTDHGACLFRPGHEIEASKHRGRAQAVCIAIEGWEHFAAAGFDVHTIRTVAMQGWNRRVDRWSKTLLRPEQIELPPRPHEDIDVETQETLDAIKESLEITDDKLPRDADIRPRSLRRLIDRYPALRRPIIHGLLRVGETMNVIAPPKAGKSWLASDMALAVATGQPWLDRFPTERGDVLIIDNELHPTTSAQRIPLVMEARGIEPASVVDHLFVSNLRGNLKDITSLGRYFDHVYEQRFRLIVIDAFYRMLPSEADENDNAAMAGVYNTIDRYAEMLGSAFVLVHHTSKGNQSYKSITDVGAGAGSQARATDSHLVLRPHEENDAIVLDAAVRSWPPTEPIGLRWNFPIWTPDDTLNTDKLRSDGRRRRNKETPEAPTEPEWDAQRFAEAFLDDEPKTADDILAKAKTGKLSGRRAQRLLGQAETAGIAHRWKFASNEKHKFATKPQPKRTAGKKS